MLGEGLRALERNPRPSYFMGVDIESGSPSSRRGAYYSIVIIDETGRIIDKYERASLARLIRLTWYYKPRILAVDNIYELSPSKKSLASILELFPAETDIVQVTLGKDGFKSLKELAAPYRDLVGSGKLSPGKTAYLVALLAKEGHGVKVRSIEPRTLVIVTKARSPRGGGFSQQRYQRRVRASVLNAAMRVKYALDEAGLDYDLRYRRSEGGLESAVFTVYAPREKLKGIVRPHRGVDYQIIIKPQYRVSLQLPGEGFVQGPPVIAGIDPGITTGVAVLDLKGRVLLLESGKNMDRAAILDLILSQGRPVVIAVDVPEVPEAVRKIAGVTGAMIYAPPGELSVAEKRLLAEKALGGRQPEDSHQRDALAAAYKAWLSVQNKMEHIERQLKKLGMDLDESKVKEAVLRGLSLAEAIESAIRARIEAELSPSEEEVQPKRAAREKPSRVDASRIEALEAEINVLREKVKSLTLENEMLQERLERELTRFKSEVYRDSLVARLEERVGTLTGEIEKLEAEIRRLKNALEELESHIVSVYSGNLVVAVKLKSLTPNNVARASSVLPSGLRGEIIYVENPVFDERALSMLSDLGVLGIIVRGSPDVSLLRKSSSRRVIPVITESEAGVSPVYDSVNYVLMPASVSEILREARARLEERIQAALRLERLISEYRRSRMEK